MVWQPAVAGDTVFTRAPTHEWFRHNDGTYWPNIKSLPEVVGDCMTTVGRGYNLVLNIAPAANDTVPAADKLRYAEFAAAIRCLFGPGSLVRESPTGAVDAAPGEATYVLPAAVTQRLRIRHTNLTLVLQED